LLVATDLDGTLLDERTHSYEPARPALAALARAGACLVLASSKTRAEMEPLARRLGLRAPLIVENGGVLLLPRRAGGYDAITLGIGRQALSRALEEIGREVGFELRGFSSLTPAEVERLTGLTGAAARQALRREHDEPLLLDNDEQAAAVAAAAERRGLRLTRGGGFFHLTGDSDKGQALRELLARLGERGRSFRTVGLGDAANDLPLLLAVERPIVIPRPGGGLDPVLARAIPGAERAPAPGPAGWNVAMLAVLAGERLPAVAGGGDG
jgi:mannosyl-3-phosphoglycerate phosphatase